MGGYPNHVKSLKGLVFQETVESCRWRSESRNLNSGLKQLLKITTASLRGGWMPNTSRSFHYWQPAPRWRLHRWLAKPGKPAMSPHAHPEDHRAEMARREGLMVPASQSPQLPISSGTQRPQNCAWAVALTTATCQLQPAHKQVSLGWVRRSKRETMLEFKTALQQTRGIHAHVDNGRPLTVQAYQH